MYTGGCMRYVLGRMKNAPTRKEVHAGRASRPRVSPHTRRHVYAIRAHSQSSYINLIDTHIMLGSGRAASTTLRYVVGRGVIAPTRKRACARGRLQTQHVVRIILLILLRVSIEILHNQKRISGFRESQYRIIENEFRDFENHNSQNLNL